MSLVSLLKNGSLRGAATATPATFATHDPIYLPTVATVATVAVASDSKQAANDLAPLPDTLAIVDPDRWCWPHSAAMTGAEIYIFDARMARFTDKGLTLDDGEALADKLVMRDRELDDRHICLECTHLAGYARQSWRCSNWKRSAVAFNARDAGLPGELVMLLQRCAGFTAAQICRGSA